MDINACFRVGHVIKTHGLKGGLRINLDTEVPENYKNLESVFLEIQGKLVPFFVKGIHLKSGYAYLQLEDVDTIERAQELKSASIYIPKELLPELDELKHFQSKIIGYKVEDKSHGHLGEVVRMESSPGQDVFVVNYSGNEVLIPDNDHIVLEVSHKTNKILVDLPDGLLALYI